MPMAMLRAVPVRPKYLRPPNILAVDLPTVLAYGSNVCVVSRSSCRIGVSDYSQLRDDCVDEIKAGRCNMAKV